MLLEVAKLQDQLERKIAVGFPALLDESIEDYRRGQVPLLTHVEKENVPPGVSPTLVETRIPLLKQAELLGISVDPSIVDLVAQHEIDQPPYIAWLKVINNFASATIEELIVKIPEGYVPATPLEGINSDVWQIIKNSFVAMPGGEFYRQTFTLAHNAQLARAFCLEEYLGRPRLTTIRLREKDRFVGVLSRLG